MIGTPDRFITHFFAVDFILDLNQGEDEMKSFKKILEKPTTFSQTTMDASWTSSTAEIRTSLQAHGN